MLPNRTYKKKFLRKIAVFCVITTCPLISFADIGAYSESSQEVMVYRALKQQFMERHGGKRLIANISKPNCDDDDVRKDSDLRKPYEITTVDEKGNYIKNLVAYPKCTTAIDTVCQSGLYNFDVQSDGRWVWTMSRIGYIAYFRALSQWAGFPNSVIGNELDALEKLTLANISRRLKLPKTIQNFNGKDGGMGLDNDNKNDDGRIHDLERVLAVKWDKYLVTLPKSRQEKLPALEFDPGCGAGETNFIVKSEPLGAKIRVISEFDWQLCRDLKWDPWDPEKCWGWSFIISKIWPLIGTYRYVASWDSGKLSRGAFKAVYPENDNSSEVNPVITLR